MAKLVADVAAGRHATSEHRTLNELLDEPDPLCEGVPATDVEPTEEASADFSAGQTGPFIGSAAASYPDAATASGQLDCLIDAIAQRDNTMELQADDGTASTATVTPLSFNRSVTARSPSGPPSKTARFRSPSTRSPPRPATS